ncbi:Uncharacterized conserved protein [Roseivivax lentus]|uniref:Uncharacterized conserved protein n=1 Tax=Roseivivax lentus TaxID=633194 RepID=A0A1N7NH83_9RHOB|nr:Uncharacterized conserved protein [Roseivivax lentus]
MTAVLFARTLDEFCATCLREGLAINISSHVVRKVGSGRYSVKWTPLRSREFRRVPDLDLQEYLECLRCGDFSLLLADGGLLQVAANFERNEIVESRYYYIPCPIEFDLAELNAGGELYPLEDFIDELTTDELKARLRIRAPFRFELDPAQEDLMHPKNHVHVGPSTSRIPVALSVCWNAFSRFIFKNFYPEDFPRVERMLQHPVPYRNNTLSDEDAYELHMSFRVSE